MKNFIALFLILIGLSSCKKGSQIEFFSMSSKKEYTQLAKAEWLLGNWEKSDSTGVLQEFWKKQNDSTFIGESYFIINEKDTVHNEQIQLIEANEHLIYTATIKGENNDEPISFEMTKDEDSLLVFENSKHDYPQKIEYQLAPSKTLIATVSGKQDGKMSTESYPMKKVK